MFRTASDDDRMQKYDCRTQRWQKAPSISPCWRGDYRRSNLSGHVYQVQCKCLYYRTYINPDGSTCALCFERRWPESEFVKAHLLPALPNTESRQNAIVEAVEQGRLHMHEARAIIKEIEDMADRK